MTHLWRHPSVLDSSLNIPTLEQANLLEKHEAASVSPKELFKAKDEYKDFAFDERGVPTHDKEGNELTKSAKKVCANSVGDVFDTFCK